MCQFFFEKQILLGIRPLVLWVPGSSGSPAFYRPVCDRTFSQPDPNYEQVQDFMTLCRANVYDDKGYPREEIEDDSDGTCTDSDEEASFVEYSEDEEDEDDYTNDEEFNNQQVFRWLKDYIKHFFKKWSKQMSDEIQTCIHSNQIETFLKFINRGNFYNEVCKELKEKEITLEVRGKNYYS